jgi:hypothetical protein
MKKEYGWNTQEKKDFMIIKAAIERIKDAVISVYSN